MILLSEWNTPAVLILLLTFLAFATGLFFSTLALLRQNERAGKPFYV